MEHVYWIGGGSGGGKSTIARRLCARYGLRLYDTDEVMSDHARRLTAEQALRLHEFIAMDMDERWLNRPPEVMLDTFHWFRGEGFTPIADDLCALPPRPPVVAEGFRLLPHLVKPLLATPRHGVWLLPTPEFRLRAFAARGSMHSIAGRTSDPPRALANLLARDEMFTERVRAEAAALDLCVVDVDGTLTEDELARRVAGAFGLSRR